MQLSQTVVQKSLRQLLTAAVWTAIAAGLVAAAHALPADEPSEPGTVLVEFYADWCGPCQAMRPAVEAIEREGIEVRRINIDVERDFAARCGVQSIPCFVVFEQGVEVDRVVGKTSIERLKLKLRIKKPAPHVVQKPVAKEPTPAWRYEQAKGHRAAIVRVYCKTGDREQTIGSGTLVALVRQNCGSHRPARRQKRQVDRHSVAQ